MLNEAEKRHETEVTCSHKSPVPYLGYTNLIFCFSDSVGLFLAESKKKSHDSPSRALDEHRVIL